MAYHNPNSRTKSRHLNRTTGPRKRKVCGNCHAYCSVQWHAQTAQYLCYTCLDRYEERQDERLREMRLTR